jgi:hypothetical protein
MAIIVTGYTRYGPLPVPPGPTTSTTTTSTTIAPTTTSTTTSTTTAGAGTTTTTSTTTTTTTTLCNFYYSNIYDDTCTLVYSNVVVAPNATPIIGYYYRGSGLGSGTIVQFLTQTCDSATYFTTLTEPGSFSCPPA